MVNVSLLNYTVGNPSQREVKYWSESSSVETHRMARETTMRSFESLDWIVEKETSVGKHSRDYEVRLASGAETTIQLRARGNQRMGGGSYQGEEYEFIRHYGKISFQPDFAQELIRKFISEYYRQTDEMHWK